MTRPKKDQGLILAAAAQIFVAFRNRIEKDTDVVTLTTEYAQNLEASPYSTDIVLRAVARFNGSLVPGRNNAYAPTLAEIYGECIKLEEAEEIHQRRVRPRLAPPPAVVNDRDRMSAAEKALADARVTSMVDDLKRTSGGSAADEKAKARYDAAWALVRDRTAQGIIDKAAHDGRDPYDGSGTFPVSDELLAITTRPPAEYHDDQP